MSSLSRLAFVSAVSGFASASAVMAFSAEPTRLAKLDVRSPAPPAAHVPQGAVRKAGDGHFWAWAEVNGQPIRFLVDTGATTVALTPEDAEALGFRPDDLKFGQQVTTASGSSRAARVTLASVSVGGARIEEVEAVVVESGLDVSLLGMSYLGRLSRFEGDRERMVLQR